LFDDENEFKPSKNTAKLSNIEEEERLKEEKEQKEIRYGLVKDLLPAKYFIIYDQINDSLMTIYLGTLLRAVIFTLVIWLIFTSWFIYHDTYL
jgi:hypothetical protein